MKASIKKRKIKWVFRLLLLATLELDSILTVRALDTVLLAHVFQSVLLSSSLSQSANVLFCFSSTTLPTVS